MPKVFDLTIAAHLVEQQFSIIIEEFDDVCEKWIFQRETGVGGYDHYQCRIKHKKRFDKDRRPEFPPGWFIKPTSVAGSGKFSYVMKEATRTEGPWKDTDEELPPRCRVELNHVQTRILEVLEHGKITIIVDPKGGHGKSILFEILEIQGKGIWNRPTATNMDQAAGYIIRECRSQPDKWDPIVVMDIPRVHPARLTEFVAWFETVADGKVVDHRHGGGKKRFWLRPRCVMVMNYAVDPNSFSQWRSNTWYIEDGELTQKKKRQWEGGENL